MKTFYKKGIPLALFCVLIISVVVFQKIGGNLEGQLVPGEGGPGAVSGCVDRCLHNYPYYYANNVNGYAIPCDACEAHVCKSAANVIQGYRDQDEACCRAFCASPDGIPAGETTYVCSGNPNTTYILPNDCSQDSVTPVSSSSQPSQSSSSVPGESSASQVISSVFPQCDVPEILQYRMGAQPAGLGWSSASEVCVGDSCNAPPFWKRVYDGGTGANLHGYEYSLNTCQPVAGYSLVSQAAPPTPIAGVSQFCLWEKPSLANSKLYVTEEGWTGLASENCAESRALGEQSGNQGYSDFILKNRLCFQGNCAVDLCLYAKEIMVGQDDYGMCSEISFHLYAPATITPGSTIQYTVRLLGEGDHGSSTLQLRDPLQSELSFNTSGNPECIVWQNNVQCFTRVAVSAGVNHYIHEDKIITYTVPSSTPCGTNIENYMFLSNNGFSEETEFPSYIESNHVSTLVVCGNGSSSQGGGNSSSTNTSNSTSNANSNSNSTFNSLSTSRSSSSGPGFPSAPSAPSTPSTSASFSSTSRSSSSVSTSRSSSSAGGSNPSASFTSISSTGSNPSACSGPFCTSSFSSFSGPNGCSEDDDCDAGICVNNSCVPCTDDSECANGRVCLNGICTQVSSSSSSSSQFITFNPSSSSRSSSSSTQGECILNSDCPSGFCFGDICIPRCGDGIREGSEQCDDGDEDDDDGCSSQCELECVFNAQCPSGICEDGLCVDDDGDDSGDDDGDNGSNSDVDGDDDGDNGDNNDFLGDDDGDNGSNNDFDGDNDGDNNGDNGDNSQQCFFDAQCPQGQQCLNGTCVNSNITIAQNSLCGNRAIDPYEQCDDGNRLQNDGCSPSCLFENRGCRSNLDCSTGQCVNGNCLPCATDDECSIGQCIENICQNPTLVASATVCGDGVLEPPEECDDANTRSGDGCNQTCMQEIGVCGDGVIQKMLGEQCENSLHDPSLPYGCVACRFASSLCGDGKIDPGEECDEGQNNANTSNAACRTSCSRSRCGDGIVDAMEACDDGNRLANDSCNSTCTGTTQVASNVTNSPFFTNISWPNMPTTQNIPFQLPLAQLQPLIQSQGPAGDTGPAALMIVAAGAASGMAWVRRKRK